MGADRRPARERLGEERYAALVAAITSVPRADWPYAAEYGRWLAGERPAAPTVPTGMAPAAAQACRDAIARVLGVWRAHDRAQGSS